MGKHVIGTRGSYLWPGRLQRTPCTGIGTSPKTSNAPTLSYSIVQNYGITPALNSHSLRTSEPTIPVPPPQDGSGQSSSFALQAVYGTLLPPDEETKLVTLKEVEGSNGRVGLGINDTLSMAAFRPRPFTSAFDSSIPSTMPFPPITTSPSIQFFLIQAAATDDIDSKPVHHVTDVGKRVETRIWTRICGRRMDHLFLPNSQLQPKQLLTPHKHTLPYLLLSKERLRRHLFLWSVSRTRPISIKYTTSLTRANTDTPFNQRHLHMCTSVTSSNPRSRTLKLFSNSSSSNHRTENANRTRRVQHLRLEWRRTLAPVQIAVVMPASMPEAVQTVKEEKDMPEEGG
ncbi:hypothetical protein CPC08DRAFT_724315 [Agrocybe pediades]|nr:hypothetical protein CPC08DRAFT_724315 [Agrocybe pediades]